MIPLPSWLTGIGARVAAVALAVLAFLAMILRIEKKGEAAGAAKVEAKNAQATAAAVAKGQQVDAAVAAKTDDAVLKEAEDKWTRHSK